MKLGIIVLPFFVATASLSSFGQSTENLRVEKFAEFPGGAEKFYKFIKENLRYPADALRDSIQGDVVVGFALDETGAINKESIKIMKGLSNSCDKEAIRVIMDAPRWIPAKSNGKDVGQFISFPVSFKME